MGFYTDYKAVFDAVKSVLVYVPAVPEVPAVPAHDEIPEVPMVPGVPAHGVESIKTVIVGEQFSYGALPKAIINAEPSLVAPGEMGGCLMFPWFSALSLWFRSMSLKTGLKKSLNHG